MAKLTGNLEFLSLNQGSENCDVFSNYQRNTCLIYNEKKLEKLSPILSQNTPNSGQQPSETLCASVVHMCPHATLVSMLTLLGCLLGVFRGRDRETEGGAPPCLLGTWDMLGTSGRIHSQGPHLPGPWSLLARPFQVHSGCAGQDSASWP